MKSKSKKVGKKKKQEKQTAVKGHATFENGSLMGVTAEVAEMRAKKEAQQAQKAQKQSPKGKKEKLADEGDEWEQYCAINKPQVEKVRQDIKRIIEETLKLPDVVWAKTSGTDFCAKVNGRLIVRICPLAGNATFSTYVPGLTPQGKLLRHTVDEVVKALPEAHAMFHKVKVEKVEKPSTKTAEQGEEMVKLLKARLESAKGNKHKGVACPKGVKLSNPAVAEFIKGEGLTVDNGKIMFAQQS